MIDTGDYIAHAFYCPRLHAETPASTFAFSKSRWSLSAAGFLGTSAVINILWKGVNAELTGKAVKEIYPEARYKGVLTGRNFLLAPGQEPLPVIGQPISLDNLQDGPICRSDVPLRPRLVVNNTVFEPRSA